MKGRHHILIETNRIRYECDLRRNITVIQGDSATGKTSLIELFELYIRNGAGGGVSLQSDVPCLVYNGSNDRWQNFFEGLEDSILFFDEDYTFIHSEEFSRMMQKTGHYYVFITRKPLSNLPYSIQEIYGIRTSGKYHFPEKV